MNLKPLLSLSLLVAMVTNRANAESSSLPRKVAELEGRAT